MMKALKKFGAVVLAVGAVVSMSACGGASVKPDGTNSAVKVFVVKFPDNSKVDCLLFDASSSAGLECAYGKDSVATETNDNLLGSFQSISGEKVRCVTYDWTKEGAMDCDI
jgi:hypothetical protein